MCVVSCPVWSGEVAVPQRAINRGPKRYHPHATRQDKTTADTGDPPTYALALTPRSRTSPAGGEGRTAELTGHGTAAAEGLARPRRPAVSTRVRVRVP
jgi:hypothetical protein